MNPTVEQTVNYLRNNEVEKQAVLAGTASLVKVTKEETLQVIKMITDHSKVSLSKYWF
ncbi:hypothetical protein ACEWK1_06570 [Metabacillus sp. YM-086]|uniref:hypothetical protein n=1 Tax=Metabacillus sp. YM-086 TaxID=3341729 RepID=UPI003A89FDB3